MGSGRSERNNEEGATYLKVNGVGGILNTSRPKHRIKIPISIRHGYAMTPSISSKEPLLPITSAQNRLIVVGCEVNHIWIPMEPDTHEIRFHM